MSTEQEILDLKLRLSAEERDMQPIKRYMRDLERMNEQAKKLANVKLSTNFIDEGTRRKILGANQAVDTLSRSMMDTARAAKAAGKMSHSAYTTLTNDILANADKLSRATTKKEEKDLTTRLRRQIKYADAYAAVFNSAAERREQIETRIRDRIAKADDAAERQRERNVERTEREILRHRQRTQRELLRSLKGGYDGMVGFGRNAALYGAAAAAGTGYAAKSALSTRMRMDTAETNMQIFGGLTKEQVEKMRSTWGDASAIKFGLSPDKMMDAFTEVAKAGIPDRIAKEVTESIMKASVGLEMDSVQTTKLAGGAATLLGDMKNLDPAKLTSIMTAIAIAARDSRADANEIVAANRRGSSVMSLGMTMEDLSAFTAGGISAGLQSSKTGTFMDYMVSELVNAKFKKGARGTALGAAATKLGMGGKAGLSAAAVANPTETLMTILDKMGEMSEQDRSKVAYQIGQREWSGELMQFVQVREKIRELLGAIKDPKNKNYLDEASSKKLQSMKGRWNSLMSAWTLLWETIGSGLEKSFSEIVPWLTNYVARLDKGKIRKSVEKIMEGMVKGLGFDSWTDMFEKTLGDPTKLKDYSETFFKIAKGFTDGIMNVINTIGKVFTVLGKAFGVNTSDPEAMARFVAEFLGFTIALRFIAPVLGTLWTLAEIIIKIGKALGAAKLAKGAVGAIAGKIGDAGSGVLGGAGKVLGGLGILQLLEDTFGQGQSNSSDQMKGLIEELKKAREQKEKENKVQKQSNLGEEVKQLGKNIEKVAFRGGLTDFSSVNRGGGIMNASYTTSSGGGGGGLSGNVLSGAGTPNALLGSTPGQALPNFGVGSGGIIKRDGIPSFSGGGGSSMSGSVPSVGSSVPSIGGAPAGGPADMSVGQGLSGNAFLQARRARFAEELKNDPNLRLHLAAMQATEGASRGGTIESLMNRADMQGKTMRQMLGFSADGVRSTDKYGRQNSFYGPIRRGEIYGAIRRMQANPAEFAKYDAFTNRALAGSHTIGGYTDQGLPTDPNGSARTGIPGLRLRGSNGKLDGNEFTDWVGPGSSWGRGRAGAMNYRRFIEQGIAGSGDAPIGSVPTPSSITSKVPEVPAGQTLGPGMMRGGFGPATININGNSHDPESLANLVQRRIDESMQWRMHDTESEYT
ncbi:phage tail tape measure protein [Bradyrhizobium diazoefficiens]|nr:hypothetical protein XF16B_46540 [Bradyrhizobium diazoefficiens]BCF70307.1 hypothetical protein XF19B_46600 [Bradyrhizobium diazoefficiens]